jgi:2'-5' RNA ligase
VTIRSFVALPVPAEVAEHLARLHETVPGDAGRVTWVKAVAIHLTFVFLGDIEEELIIPIREALEAAASGTDPFETSLGAVGAFPNLRRPRVIWAGLEKGADEAVRFKQRIDEMLLPLGFEAERKRFSPHITIGRVRSTGRPGAIEQAAAEWILPQETWISQDVIFYQSELTRSGPIYTALARVPLGRNG